MSAVNEGHLRVLKGALAAMIQRPTPLTAALQFTSEWESPAGKIGDAEQLLDLLRDCNLNSPLVRILAKRLRDWDYAGEGWTHDKITKGRREEIYTRLGIPQDFRDWCDKAVPIYEPAEPLVVISADHIDWYKPNTPGTERFYWEAYVDYLETISGWEHESLIDLDQSTTAVVERLADPTSSQPRQTRGLVVGYVQSGKTANFTGVVAKAADAGYRLIIILAGTLDILRNQTQRRLDKELVGRELIEHEYDDDDAYPDGFVTYGSRPSVRGSFDFERLTLRLEDYQGLDAGIAALRFERRLPGVPLFDEDNLRNEPARLLVIKKNRIIIEKVVGDLERVSETIPLSEIPTLIIDDGSDQASLNTRKPTTKQVRERTAINKVIVKLLKMLPRAQYVGYTATPFANVFVDPDDVDDLFPKDYLIPLPRPSAYMGVADFHDLEGTSSDDPYDGNEGALVRAVRGLDNAPANLTKAVDAFVLAGAIKLWRAHENPNLRFRHHTMLVHVSPRRDQQRLMAQRLEEIWLKSAYEGGDGVGRLRVLWDTDFEPVMRHRAVEAEIPTSFADIQPYIGRCLSLIDDGEKRILIVNSDNKSDDPDFEHGRVWKILVGGAKLSRGYTVEGLTISYYRRRAEAADTLMQMGRWFGFRQGYRDLVRLFIGRAEPLPKGGGTIDLYLAFEGVCRDEIDFRHELQKYALPKYGGKGIRPSQVPPLVSSYVLRPTASNKMYNAEIEFQNLSGDYIERTVAPADRLRMEHNEEVARTLIGSLETTAMERIEYLYDGKQVAFEALIGVGLPMVGLQFLRDYRWADDHPVMQRVIDFLADRSPAETRVKRWVLVAPQSGTDLAPWMWGSVPLSVQRRARAQPGARYKVYSTPRDVRFAKGLVGLGDGVAITGGTTGLIGGDQAILLLYPVRDTNGGEKADFTTMGFAIQFPQNQIAIPIKFGVRVATRPDDVVVPKEA